MSFYQQRILPHLIQMAMTQEHFEPYRRRAAGAARGRILEIGVGSGLNLPLYGAGARVVGVDPSATLLSMARSANADRSQSVELIEGSAESLPLPDHEFDTVVTTWTMCSIPNLPQALAEVRRVLKPDGKLVFAEHGRAPESSVVRWQNALTPVWKRIGGGCHLNRPIDQLIAAAGFRIDELKTGYMKGPKPMTFMYEGEASLVR
ncbi:MAG TPA: class I SAM-dependent methyltransferase [Vicinamibacterales bacterium]|nr:class I SAM-dependent methyltransferase [Vicinamibacterales bacterium]